LGLGQGLCDFGIGLGLGPSDFEVRSVFDLISAGHHIVFADSFYTKKLCSRLSSSEVRFLRKSTVLRFWDQPP